MSDLNLRALVRDVLRETSEADPGVIAEAVLGLIPAKQSREALEQTMRLFVRQVISEVRVSNAPTAKVTPIRPTTSWKGAVRDGWQRRLRDRVHVGGSEWRLLADCTYSDLMAAAAERQEHADRNAAWARTYRAFADAIQEAGVETFADLPAESQMNLLGAA